MSYVLGLNAKLFRGTSGSTAATEVKGVTNLTVNLSTGEADVTSRRSSGWKQTLSTLKDASLEIEMLYDTADSDIVAFQSAYFSNTAMALFVTDGSGNGLDADFVITNFSIPQNLEEALKVSITAKPTSVGSPGRTPVWVTGSSASQL